MASLSFYYDLASPRAYLAAERLYSLAQRTHTAVSWRPISQAILDDLTGASVAPPVDTWSTAKASLTQADLLRQARLQGTQLHPTPLATPPPDLDAAHALLLGCPEALRAAVSLDLFRAVWVEGDDLSDPQRLRDLAHRHGLTLPLPGEDLRAATAEAAQRGVFAVPTVVSAGRLWWGLDRLPLLEASLGLSPTRPPVKRWHSPVKRIRFFHDLASPFSYLGATQIDSLAERAGVTVDWTPILLGALFREIGTPNVPLLVMTEARRAYLRQDLADWAAWWGVPFRFPSTFPVRTVLPLRACLLAPEATLPLYRALWAEDRDIGQPEVVREVLDDLGLDGAALLEATQAPPVKAQLQENTAQAQAAGVCGVPTVSVGGVLLWGQDQLPLLEGMLAGRYEIR